MLEVSYNLYLRRLSGFIPNCAASVILSQLFIDGVVSFGALTAGLITSAGLGLLVLFKMYDNKKDICRILGILIYNCSCHWKYFTNS